MKYHIVVDEIDRDDLVNLFSMEAGGFDYWAMLDWDENDYDNAKKKLMIDKPADTICYEDVLAEIIMSGGSILVNDYEEEKLYTLNKKMIVEGFKLNAEQRPHDPILEDGDAITGDCILQYAIFGDLIYG